MSVRAESDDPDVVRKLIAIAARACAVTNTLRRSAPLTVEFEGAPVDVG
jgi:uncharacterized OsmC-like protein